MRHIRKAHRVAHFPDLEGWVGQQLLCFGDANAVEQVGKTLSRVLGNILSNAVKYSDGDLKIVLSEDGDIRISNHASGLSEVQAERLFDRFYTVNTARKSTGLGLSIAKALMEKMGGTITADYRENVLEICVSVQKL